MEDDEETGKDCRSWEEDVYWTHFRSIHFLQFLHGDFRLQLAFPKKFSDNMKNNIPENVLLKGPSGSIWKVGIAAEEDGLFFKRGWEAFVKDHLLAENDALMFKYNGDSRFEVLMFDHRSLCEKEASYFCKRVVGPKEREEEVRTKRKAREGSEVVAESPLPRDTEHAPAEEPLNEEEAVPVTVEDFRVVSRKRASPAKIGNSSPIVINQERKRRAVKSPPAYSTPTKEERVVRRRPARKDLRFKHVYASSKKTPVQSQEQILAIERAQAAVKSDSFIVVMQPTHVYKRFYMSIPVEWADKHLSRCKQDLILRVKDKIWHARYNYSARNCGGIASGWKNFALDNYLVESDVCLFDIGGNADGTVVLDVSIFRVAAESPINAVPQTSMPATDSNGFI